MAEEKDNPLALFTVDEMMSEIKARSKVLFFVYEPVADEDLDWAHAWKSTDNKVRTAIALADEAAFYLRLKNRPIDVPHPEQIPDNED